MLKINKNICPEPKRFGAFLKYERKTEKIRTNDETKINHRDPHYSEKGGHFLRGCYWKAWGKLLIEDGDCSQGYRALLILVEATRQRRRFMPRYGVQDGRR